MIKRYMADHGSRATGPENTQAQTIALAVFALVTFLLVALSMGYGL